MSIFVGGSWAPCVYPALLTHCNRFCNTYVDPHIYAPAGLHVAMCLCFPFLTPLFSSNMLQVSAQWYRSHRSSTRPHLVKVPPLSQWFHGLWKFQTQITAAASFCISLNLRGWFGNLCDGLNEQCPHRPVCLNTWFSGNGAVWLLNL